MLKIRLKRVGRKNTPLFRVVLVDSQKGPQTGKINEILGWYNPHTNEKEIKTDRVEYWMGHGAQVSDTVHNLLVDLKAIDGRKINVLPQKSPVVKEAEETKEEPKKEESKTEEPKAEGEADSSEEASAELTDEEKVEEAPAEEKKEEAPTDESKDDESKEEPKTEETKEEAPVEPEKTEEVPEEKEEEKKEE